MIFLFKKLWPFRKKGYPTLDLFTLKLLEAAKPHLTMENFCKVKQLPGNPGSTIKFRRYFNSEWEDKEVSGKSCPIDYEI